MQPFRSSILSTIAALTVLAGDGSAQARWSRLYPANAPSPRSRTCFGFFGATGELVMLLGERSGTNLTDGWLLDDNTWRPMTGPLPPFRRDLSMAYDSVRERLVMFSGSIQLSDTWEWDGVSWLQRTPVTSPLPRSDYAMGFDPLRGVTVLYGGLRAGALQDLWEWNGTNWLRRSVPGGPGPRSYSLMAFDAENGDMLLFGGSDGAAWFNDTWSWNGVAWQQRFPATPPTHRIRGRMVADLARRRVVLHGGDFQAGPYAWEWDGAEWNMLLQASPSQRIYAAMVYDSVRSRVVVVGGRLPTGGDVGDTWSFEVVTPATATAYQSGCAGAAGVPELGPAQFRRPWLGDLHTNEVRNLAPTSGGVFFVTGFDPTAPISLAKAGMPGCEQHVNPLVTEFVPATNGMASWSLTIPNAPALANVRLVQQVVALDAGANAAGLTVSNGLEMTVGIR
ncbi:MAG: hypothetical protein NXI31_11185 [bacterium]|nr:hypothetical protein [bacterium]